MINIKNLRLYVYLRLNKREKSRYFSRLFHFKHQKPPILFKINNLILNKYLILNIYWF